MRLIHKLPYLIMLLAVGLSSCLQPPQSDTSEPTSTQVDADTDTTAIIPDASAELESPAPLLINLTSDPTQAAHAVLMGLHLAQHMHEAGMEVTVFLNVGGVNLLAPIAAEVSFEGQTFQGLLNELLAADIEVVACPHCMDINGLRPDDVPAGIKIGKPELMAELLTSSPTVFTY